MVIGLLRLARGAERVAGLTERELLILQHLVASHHGRLELGAAVTPMTLEAEILHFADDASAKSASMADAVADADNFAGDDLVSARALWQLDRRRAYRGASDWGMARVPGNENGRLVVARRPSHDWTNQGRSITAAVLLPPATSWLIRRSGGRGEALASIPRPDGHPTWFIHSSAASRIGSRTDLSHCTPRRKIGADEARDWLHLFKPG